MLALLGSLTLALASADVRFTLDLRLPDGSAPKTAQVFIEEANGPFLWHAWSSPSDEFVSATESARIHVFGEPYADIHSRSRGFLTGVPSRWISDVLTVSAKDAGAGPVTVPLRSRQHLDVTLKSPTGTYSMRTHPFVWVLSPDEFEPELGYRILRDKKAHGMSFTSGASPKPPTGYVPDVELGEVIVTCGESFDPFKSWARVKIVEGRNHVELIVADPDADGRFSLAVKTHDGYLAQQLSYRMEVRRAMSSSDTTIQPVEQKDGRAYFRWSEALKPSDIAYLKGADFDPKHSELTILLSVSSTDGSAGSVPLQWGTEEYDVRLNPPADVTLTIRGEGADRFILQMVALDAKAEKALGLDGGDTEVAMGALPSGRYRLRWIAKDQGNMRRQRRRNGEPWLRSARGFVHADSALDVRPGEQTIEVEVPVLRPATLRLVAGGEPKRLGGPFRIYRRLAGESDSMRDSLSVRADDEGAILIDGIGPGEYRLSLGGWCRPIDFELTGSAFTDEVETLELEVVEAVASRVQITEHGGELARSGLEHGDLIVGLGGERFQNLEEVQGCFARAREDIVVLQILRGEEELEIELELLPFDPEKGVGGGLVPVFELPESGSR